MTWTHDPARAAACQKAIDAYYERKNAEIAASFESRRPPKPGSDMPPSLTRTITERREERRYPQHKRGRDRWSDCTGRFK